ncbi:hypothetical protein ACYZT9_00595 [Pseudomonas sp. ZT5P21]
MTDHALDDGENHPLVEKNHLVSIPPPGQFLLGATALAVTA